MRFLLDHALAEIGVESAGCASTPGSTEVVLLGNSGGGSPHGRLPVAGRRAERHACRRDRGRLDAIADLPRAFDLFIALFRALRPSSEVFTAWLDPLGEQTRPTRRRGGPVRSTRSTRTTGPHLRKRGFPAPLPGRAARPQRAHHRLGTWPGWTPWRVPAGAGQACSPSPAAGPSLRMIDPAIEPSDRKPNWCYLGEPVKRQHLRGVRRRNRSSTLRTWLSMWSLQDIALHRGAAPGQDHAAIPRRARHRGRPASTRTDASHPVRLARRGGQDTRVRQGGSLPPLEAGRGCPRAGGRSSSRPGQPITNDAFRRAGRISTECRSWIHVIDWRANVHPQVDRAYPTTRERPTT